MLPTRENNLNLLSFQFRNLETNQVFPRSEKSAYKSSDFDDSFDFPFNPDPLSQSNNYSIYDEMQHDDQIKSALSFKKDLIVSSGWTIKTENEEIKNYIEENLNFFLENSFDDWILDALSAFNYGFSLTEVTYRKPTKTGLYEIRTLKVRPPHSFHFELDGLGNVERIVQRQTSGERQFHPNYFIHHTYRPQFGNPYGQSDLRAAHTAWVAKKFFMRMWAMYVERFAKPTVVGRAPENAGTSELEAIHKTLKTIQDSTVLALPHGTELDFVSDSRNGSEIYSKAISHLNMIMARAVLLPDLMGMSGEKTSGGSFAQSKTHFQMFINMIEKEKRAIARRFNMKVIKPLVRANWGDQFCEFEFNRFNEKDLSENLKLWSDVVKGKVYRPTEEEITHFKDSINFPTNEPVERPKPKPENPDVNTPENEGKETPEEIGNTDEKIENSQKNFVLLRDKTEFESKVNFAEIQKTLDTAERRVDPALKESAKEIWEDLLTQIDKKNAFGNKVKPDAFNDVKPRMQRSMNVAFRRHFRSLYKQAFNAAQEEVFPNKKPKFKNFQEGKELLPEEFLKIIEAESFKLVGDYSVQIVKKAKNTMVTGIKNSLGEKAVLKAIREEMKRETDKWLKTVIRTKSTEIFNRARKSFYDNDPDASQIVEAFQYSAIIDSRTSEVCSSLDGKIFKKGEFTGQIVPPLHFNCRSLLVPVTKFESYKPTNPPTLDSLKDKGGNLIFIQEDK